ncbi:MAG: uracil-DNA glycosylase [Meiothermus sp.]|nr:uracil-DNA glycosylase [Meiothermus sp.]
MNREAALVQLNSELFSLPLPEGVTQIVPGEGDPNSPVVLVGHAPGSTDNETGRPYSGPAGELLNQLLAEAGLQRHEVYITNLVKVWTWKQETSGRVNRTPGAGEIKAWSKVLKVELELIAPKALVCLGGPTAQHFLGKGFKITQSAGQWLPWPTESPYLKIVGESGFRPVVMGIPQPNYLIHLQQHAPEAYPDARANMVAHLIRVKRYLEQAGNIRD